MFARLMPHEGRFFEYFTEHATLILQGAVELKEGSPYRFIAESGIEATTKHEGLLGSVDMITKFVRKLADAGVAPKAVTRRLMW